MTTNPKGSPPPTRSPDATAARVAAEFLRHAEAPLAPALYLVATPIGNLGDITLRALAVLTRADAVWCEDTRHSGSLLAHFAIRASSLRPYHEHNAETERPRILAHLQRGGSAALITDAGTPLVSDPGFKLVREAVAAGIAVFALPGPSALLAGLSVSGQPTDAFCFAGFLPARETARRKRIDELAAIPASLVLFEAPTRAAATLADLAERLGPRPAAIARELTKLHEEVRRGPLDVLAKEAATDEPRGEIVIVVGPPVHAEVTDDDIRRRLEVALAASSVRDAARKVADDLGIQKARVYELALHMKERSS